MPTNPAILGRGWAFPFRFTSKGGIQKSGGLTTADGLELVKMSIIQILGTKIGSRVIDRDFGSNLRGLIFTPIDNLSAARIRGAVSDAITDNEKRVTLLNVSVDISQAKEGKIIASIDFQLITTQQVGNLVYPFFLTPDMFEQGQITIG